MRRLLPLISILFILAGVVGAINVSGKSQQPVVIMAEIDGGISPATEEYLEGAVATAKRDGASAIILRLDTPGGLVDSMRGMVSTILESDVPVVVWVAPAGARAASAGAFIVAASHVAVMSPQSTMGAASPVGMGGKDVDATMKKKVVNDLVSLIRGVAQSRGRNADWYEGAVVDADSITASDAVLEGVVDFIAVDRADLVDQLAVSGKVKGLVQSNSDQISFQQYDPGLRYRLLAWLLEPQVAYLLLMAGMAGMFFEFTTPGAVFPGVFGGLCLLLALYALSVLPTNVAGILLIVFAGVLIVLEAFITSFGMLGIAALAALFFGSTILFKPVPGFEGLPLGIVISTCLTVALIMGGCLWLIAKAQLRSPAGGADSMVGRVGEVRHWDEEGGSVTVRGEIWKADGRGNFESGQSVRVVARDGLTVSVEPLSEAEKAES